MADVTLTFNFDTEDQAGPCTVTLPNGRAFEHGAVVKWRTKEAAEAAVREHFGALRDYIDGGRGITFNVASPWAERCEATGQSTADVEADLRLIGIHLVTGAALAAEAEAPLPQQPDDAADHPRAPGWYWVRLEGISGWFPMLLEHKLYECGSTAATSVDDVTEWGPRMVAPEDGDS